MHEIKLDPLPIVTGDPDELLDLDICDTCEFATTQAARIAAICEQVTRYAVTRYIAPGRQIIVAPSTRTPGGWQVTFYHADRQTGELVPIGHADRDTADDLARIAEAIKARSETDDDVPAIAFALSRRTVSHFTEA